MQYEEKSTQVPSWGKQKNIEVFKYIVGTNVEEKKDSIKILIFEEHTGDYQWGKKLVQKK